MNYVLKIARLQTVEEELVARDVALRLIKGNLVKARDRMKFADLHRTERELQ